MTTGRAQGARETAGAPERAEEVEVSLVVCTRDRAAQLRRTLESLARISDDTPWELIVVDNGSRDATPRVLEEFRAGFRRPMRIVREPRPGLARARNTGLARVRGEIVVFTDDDCYPAEDYLTRARECFAAGPADLGYVGGRILLHDPTDLPLTIRTSEEPLDVPAGAFVRTGLIQGANMAYRRAALESVGGFDDRLGPGTPFNCEDVDMQARLSAAGWRGRYDPGPLVYHHHGRKTAEDARALQRSYDHGRGAYYAKCLLIPALRGACARHWLGTVRRARVGRTLREVEGGIQFWIHLLRNRSENPGREEEQPMDVAP